MNEEQAARALALYHTRRHPEEALAEIASLRAKLAAAEAVVEAAREHNLSVTYLEQEGSRLLDMDGAKLFRLQVALAAYDKAKGER